MVEKKVYHRFCTKCQKDVEVLVKKVGPHIGWYCKECGRWFGWVSKKRGEIMLELQTGVPIARVNLDE